MAIESQNIYKNARKSAGFTQEKASQLLNVSVDSLRDYEQSQRPVPSDVASAMCDVYQAPYLAVQHLRLTSDLGKRVVPEIQLKDLPEAVRKSGLTPPGIIAVGEVCAFHFTSMVPGALTGITVGVTGTEAVGGRIMDRLAVEGAKTIRAGESVVVREPMDRLDQECRT